MESHNCTLENGKRNLRFANRGVAIALQGSSPEPVIVKARVTLEETIRISALSEREVTARIDKPLREGVWLFEGDWTGRLPVSIANALINPASPCVPVRMINTQSESVVVFKGTKVGVVEETEGPPSTELLLWNQAQERALRSQRPNEKGSGRW